MPTAEQCNAYAAEYRLLVQQVDVSIRRAATLMAISQSWTILADQLERLADITKNTPYLWLHPGRGEVSPPGTSPAGLFRRVSQPNRFAKVRDLGVTV
jgi:hypothetical protein